MNFDITPEISISLSEILVALLAILASGLGYIIKEQRDKIKGIRSQLSDKKYKVYYEVYSVFFDLFKQEKGQEKRQDPTKLGARLVDIKKDLFIYAPDEIVKKFTEWNNFINNNPNNIRHILIFLDLCILIRKDMGHEKTEIINLEILRSIMTTDEEFEKMKKMLEDREPSKLSNT